MAAPALCSNCRSECRWVPENHRLAEIAGGSPLWRLHSPKQGMFAFYAASHNNAVAVTTNPNNGSGKQHTFISTFESGLPTTSFQGLLKPPQGGFFLVRPAWAHTCGCKSRCELVTVSKVKRNCVRVTERGKEA